MSATATTEEKRRASRGVDQEPVSFRLMAWAISLVVLALLTSAILARPDSISTSWHELLPWVILAAATSLVPLSFEGGPALAMDLPVLLGAGFVHGPVFAGLVGIIACVDIREFRGQVSLPRAFLNRSQIALSVMVASLVFHGLHARLGSWPGAALAGLLALGADCIVNYTLVALATSLLSRRPISKVMRQMRLGSVATFAPVYLCFGFLGTLLAETYVRLGFGAIAGFFAPIVLARQAFVHWRRLDEADKSIQAKNDALRSVDERIADERQDERARIAAALHDDVLQCLYNVTIRTQIMREDLRFGRLLDLDDDLPALLSASEQAVEELRDVIRDLRRSTIGHAGLVDTLTLLVDHLEKESGIQFVSELDPTVKADPSAELVLYQIAREALTNTQKHSGAKTVWVSLRHDGRLIVLAVEDDGCGFDTHGESDGRHFGVELMRERAAMVGATLELSSTLGSGTSVQLKMPPKASQ
jgi:signal transduction histidine kinase